MVGDASMIYFIITINLLRSSIIAGKYATYSPEYIRKVRRKAITEREIDGELMLAYWHLQSDDLIKKEVDSSIDRLQIDQSLFYIAFMTDDCCQMK